MAVKTGRAITELASGLTIAGETVQRVEHDHVVGDRRLVADHAEGDREHEEDQERLPAGYPLPLVLEPLRAGG